MQESISSLKSVFKQHRWPAIVTFISVICGSLVYLVVTPPKYETSVRVMLNDKQLSVSDIGRDLTQLSEIGQSNPIATQAELARSERVLVQAVTQVSLKGVNDVPKAETLKEDLQVTTIPATNILRISYKSQNPVLTSSVLNAVAGAMVKENAEVIRSQARSAREFLETELPKKRSQLASAEAAIAQYKQSQGIVSISDSEGNDSAQTQNLVTSLADLDRQELALYTQLQDAMVRNNSLRQTTDADTRENAYAMVRAGQDEELKQLRAKLADLESQVAIARKRFTDNNPTLIKLIEQRDATRTLYTQNLSKLSPQNNSINSSADIASDPVSQELATKVILSEIEKAGLEAKLAQVRDAKAQLQARVNQLPAKEQALNALSRQRLDIAASVDLLQKKLEEARIAEVQLASNISIIDTASPPVNPNWPNKPVVLIVATLAGMFLSVGVVVLLDFLDGTLRNATEVGKLVKLPIIGVLPVLPDSSLNGENSEFLNNSGLVEPYRKLLWTIQFRSDKHLQVFVVSSPQPGEGKSIVASHLAAVAAMSSRRTLLIDTNLHCPTQQKLFNLVVRSGLTDAIDGRVTLAKAVQQTSIKNLWVLGCGEPHANPSRFSDSARMQTLLAEAAAQYDLVIIDTPSVTSSVDAIALSHNSDGLLLVTRSNFTQKDTLVQVVSDLTNNQVPILGITVNGINSQTEKHYRYPVKDDQPLEHQNYERRVLENVDQ
ncbi:polysaccharide biosynthesis tyrosine autokinase [Gloeocapsopsis crepidinum LEGE 06123]|uniref:Polysaccharide biosynthesis tyrosine autokinase n=1 Tax=Gloeocapsopsis crepidinum LEGE 06123 TaxID=588587 RepID=A0ABR9UKL0_9CHRO|nr:polysaccharide biosynthesis tyrosine autokinase [Gloeocapsopsis crepidinum]MBE9188823.1 polysaccharide biosynthesis tyrosine autokinase [Gloeocapsopsis crepidinum LEGE 06123]